MSESVGVRDWARRWVVGTALALVVGCWWTAVAPLVQAEEEPAALVVHWWAVEGADSRPTIWPTGKPPLEFVMPPAEDLELWVEAAEPLGDFAVSASGDPPRAIPGYWVYPLPSPPDTGNEPSPLSWTLEGACRPGDVVFLVSSEAMTSPVTLQRQHCQDGLEISHLLARGTVASRALPPAAEAAQGEEPWAEPVAGWLEVEECSAVPTARRSTPERLPVAVNPTGDWWLPVPARECQHVTLKLGDLSPTTWWGVILEGGEERALESRRLKRGASILVQVTSDRDGRAVAGVEVGALEEAAAASGAASEAGPERFTVRSATGDWGWARLSGLAEGFYVVRAQHEASGGLATSELLEVTVGEERVLDLELESPASLTLLVAPDAEVLEEPLRLEVTLYEGSRESWSGGTNFSGEVASGEPLTFPGLKPGVWTLTAALRLGPLAGQEVHGRELNLVPGEDRREVLEPDRALRLGEVLLRGEPVRGSLIFRQEAPEPAEESDAAIGPIAFGDAFAESDEEGRFAVFLLPGTYQVIFHGAEEVGTVLTPPFEVAEADEDIVVRLPGGRVSGWVVNGEGEPVTGAAVTALRLSDASGEGLQPLMATSRTEDGRFTVDGLAAGEWMLEARREGRQGHETVALAPDELREGVEIVLGEEISIAGTVVTTSGRPVGLARAAGLITHPAGGPPRNLRFQTDVRGRFELELPNQPGALLMVQLTGAGIPLSAARVAVEEEVRLVVPDRGGRVVFRGSMEAFSAGRMLLVNGEGAIIHPAMLGHDGGGAMVQGASEVTFTHLAVGDWRAVAIDSAQAVMGVFRGDFSGVRTLATFVVEPGGSVEVMFE